MTTPFPATDPAPTTPSALTDCQHCGQPIVLASVPRPFTIDKRMEAWVHVDPAFAGNRRLCRVTHASPAPEETSTT